MKFAGKVLGSAAMLLAVTACGGGSQYGGGPMSATGDMAAARQASATSPFNENLRKGYLELASNGARDSDWIDSGIFARKARLAAEGEDVQPEDPENWGDDPSLGGSTPETTAELQAARSELMGALGTGRTSNPTQAARAQVMYDCWVEKAESVYWLVDDCKAKFYEALNAMRARPAAAPVAPAAPPARDYLVFFDFDRSNIRPDAADVLRRVSTAFRSLNSNQVDLIGHADRSGADAYNQRLSQRRAQSVKDYLSRQGVPSNAITATGRGEADPRVPTPDGVREQENRRVEIRLQ